MTTWCSLRVTGTTLNCAKSSAILHLTDSLIFPTSLYLQARTSQHNSPSSKTSYVPSPPSSRGPLPAQHLVTSHTLQIHPSSSLPNRHVDPAKLRRCSRCSLPRRYPRPVHAVLKNPRSWLLCPSPRLLHLPHNLRHLWRCRLHLPTCYRQPKNRTMGDC